MANKATGETLPGLSLAQDVSHLHEVLQKIKSMDEARKKKQQLKEEEKEAKKDKLSMRSTGPDSAPNLATRGG